MRTTLAIEDELLAKAQAMTGISATAPLVHEVLNALVQREAARRLAKLGGSQPGLKEPRRRRAS